ncbi:MULTISPECIES: AMP-binding enzyme [unclassified Shewanella]|uniref:AMP-binding enzyme n=1 Tax=unclassified Shewanella TaxID=196818 RepID=UPI0021D99FF4|nr:MULTISPECIES: class I adenylate-forming enzyme family protein [unclassified Shewanella]MCU8044152.1 acyl--CoA ligase [Shewanella sp. SM68]MCU8048234.1 acyl--CoA ligase [Shewanella sp. SM65]
MKNIQNNNQETILSLLNIVPGDRFFLSVESKNITYAEIVNISNRFIDENSQYLGCNIAVKFKNRELATKFLPAVSYLAKNLLILPDDLQEEIEQDFFIKTQSNYHFNFNEAGVEITKISEPVFDGLKRKMILATSGTTGTPKLVSYELKQLIGTAKTDIAKGLAYNWALVYDVNRFAGLQVYFQTILSGSKLTILESDSSIAQVINLLINSNANCLSATPSFFRKLLMDPKSASINFTRITLGGEIAEQTILNSLKTIYPQAKIIHIYASTEAGVGFSVKDVKEGFPLAFLDETALLGTSLKIKDGTLWIKSKNTSNTMISGLLELDMDGYINTGDLVAIVDDRILFMGRESGTINVGGNKVIPEEIERVILKHDAISECYVFGKKNSMMGMLVACEVVLKDPSIDKNYIKKDLQSFCHTQLQPFKVPALVKFVSEIEKNSVGKVMRGKAS